MKIKYFLAAAVLALVTSGVSAGLQQPAQVEVDLDAGRAQGDMVTSRYSSNKEEFIGCGTRNFDDGVGGVFAQAFCQARDKDGDQFTCFTLNAKLIDRIEAINDYSFITFSWDPNDGTCLSMGFSTQSFYLPRGLNANGNNGNGNGGMGN